MHLDDINDIDRKLKTSKDLRCMSKMILRLSICIKLIYIALFLTLKHLIGKHCLIMCKDSVSAVPHPKKMRKGGDIIFQELRLVFHLSFFFRYKH